MGTTKLNVFFAILVSLSTANLWALEYSETHKIKADQLRRFEQSIYDGKVTRTVLDEFRKFLTSEVARLSKQKNSPELLAYLSAMVQLELTFNFYRREKFAIAADELQARGELLASYYTRAIDYDNHWDDVRKKNRKSARTTSQGNFHSDDYNKNGVVDMWDEADRERDRLFNPDKGSPQDYNKSGTVDRWDEIDRESDRRLNPDKGSPLDYNKDGTNNMWDEVDKAKDDFWNQD